MYYVRGGLQVGGNILSESEMFENEMRALPARDFSDHSLNTAVSAVY
jgi:hypothetical protein